MTKILTYAVAGFGAWLLYRKFRREKSWQTFIASLWTTPAGAKANG